MQLSDRFVSAVMVFGLAVFLWAAQGPDALAAEHGQIRIGGDYSYIKVPAGRDYRWCAQTCDNDARCKSWTFIRPNRQCRLKYIVAPARANECCISGVKKRKSGNSRREACAEYASRALEQQDENLAGKCGFKGDLWSSNYKRHFRACLNMPDNRRAVLTGQRKKALERCEDNRTKLDAACQRFADSIERIWQSGNDNNCSLRPAKWLGSFPQAYGFCKAAENPPLEDMLKGKRAELSACLARGGGSYVKRCDTYARDALTQVLDGRKADCGYKGRRWSKEYADHYQWCLKVEPWDLRNEKESRDIALETCREQGGEGKEGQIACDHYARLAAEQTRSNRKLGCGLKGRRWLADYDRHFAWCKTTSRRNREQELRYREDELARCFERGGGNYDETCDDYARAAIRQNDKNLKNGCNYRGKNWHSNYQRHYKWCADAKPARRAKKRLQRKLALETCKIGLRLPFDLER
jgi:translation initiation factor 2 beta subunit (eIF-2beta)/eIF-5